MRQASATSKYVLAADQAAEIDALALQLSRPAHELVREAIRAYVDRFSAGPALATVDAATDDHFGSWEGSGVNGVHYENEARQK